MWPGTTDGNKPLKKRSVNIYLGRGGQNINASLRARPSSRRDVGSPLPRRGTGPRHRWRRPEPRWRQWIRPRTPSTYRKFGLRWASVRCVNVRHDCINNYLRPILRSTHYIAWIVNVSLSLSLFDPQFIFLF